jgi:hypothetical protein
VPVGAVKSAGMSVLTAIGRLGEILCSPPIAVISFNRPDYVGQLLASLAAQQPAIRPARVHLFQDGAVNRYSGIRYAADADIAASLAVFREYFPQGHVHASPDNIGITENILRAETLFFEELRAPVGYFFEDDLVLSPHYVAALDLMRRAFARFDRIGYFNANGAYGASLDQQRSNAGKLIFMGHFWGFALKRSHWLCMQPYLADYHRLAIGRDERIAPREDIRALFRSWGKTETHPHTGQDSARDLATHLLRRWRASCYPALGRYIGVEGEHFTPELFARFGFDKTAIYPEPLGRLDLRRDEVDRVIDENLAARSAIFAKAYADQIAALGKS